MNLLRLIIQSFKLTKLILIECDCLKQTEKQIFSKPIVVDSLRDKLTNCNRNIYMSKDRVEKCLFIFNFMISFVNHSKSRDKNSFKTVKFMYNECTPHVIDYLMRRMSEADLYFGKLQFYINLLENLIDFDFDSELGLVMPLVSDKLVKQMLPLIESNLNMAVSNEFSSEWKRFICLAMYICLIRSLKLNNTKSAQLIEFALRNKQILIKFCLSQGNSTTEKYFVNKKTSLVGRGCLDHNKLWSTSTRFHHQFNAGIVSSFESYKDSYIGET